MTNLALREKGAIRLSWNGRDAYALVSSSAVSGAQSFAIYTPVSKYSGEFSYLMHESKKFVEEHSADE